MPPSTRRPQRRELCAVPWLKARDWLCGEETKANRKAKLRSSMRAWIWDWLEGQWTEATRASLLPGRIVCVAAACGGYRPERGFDPDSRAAVPEGGQDPFVQSTLRAVPAKGSCPLSTALDEADDQQDGENLTITAAACRFAASEKATACRPSPSIPPRRRCRSFRSPWNPPPSAFRRAPVPVGANAAAVCSTASARRDWRIWNRYCGLRMFGPRDGRPTTRLWLRR